MLNKNDLQNNRLVNDDADESKKVKYQMLQLHQVIHLLKIQTINLLMKKKMRVKVLMNLIIKRTTIKMNLIRKMLIFTTMLPHQPMIL